MLPQNFARIFLSSHGFYAFRKSLPLLFDHKNCLPKIEYYDFSLYVIDASLQFRPVSCLTCLNSHTKAVLQSKGKGKAVPLEAYIGSEGSRIS